MKLKGKCKTCLGCGMLEDKGFKGRKKCKYYIRADKEPIWLILVVFFMIILLAGIYFGFEKFSMLAGG